ncbi:MAG TPA: hypothetical protein VK427_06470, partial [Kofleriaceae bacterium]|nr:hypothetical protein [Kofleriaceae bacterium]
MTVVIERAALVLIAMASIAHAQAPNPADAAFKRGRELVAAGRHADACIEFEHSQKLDPAKGTAYNIALCSEKTGKLARALQLCRELAATDTKVDRKKVVVEMIPKLEARVPHLVIKAPTPPLGFLLTITPINGHPRSFEANKPIEM